MNEALWLNCTDLGAMFDFLKGKTSDRKQRLFACACCRRIWYLVHENRSRKAAEVAERYADGLATEEERQAAWAALQVVFVPFPYTIGMKNALAAIVSTAGPSPFDRSPVVARDARNAVIFRDIPPEDVISGVVFSDGAPKVSEEILSTEAREFDRAVEEAAQADLVRDLFGNPFCPVTLDPTWLTRNGGTTRKLAKTIYNELDFAALPALADALEDAGCTEYALLDHCRGSTPHARGCWALDLLLKKNDSSPLSCTAGGDIFTEV
jgi:hypothetical protein